MFVDSDILGLHGGLRHPVPPAPVVPATRGWLLQEPKFRCGLLLTHNKPPSLMLAGTAASRLLPHPPS